MVTNPTQIGYSSGQQSSSPHRGMAVSASGITYSAVPNVDHVPELADPWTRYHIYDKMLTDSRIASTIRALFQPILGAKWEIHPRNADNAVTEHIAHDFNLTIQKADESWPDRSGFRFDFQDFLYHCLFSLVYGVFFFEKVYRVEDDGLLHLSKLAPRLPHTLAYDGIQVDRDGGLKSITQRGLNGQRDIVIPVERLLAITHEKVDGNWRGRSVLRPIYGDWLMKHHAMRINSIHIDRNGTGVVVAEGPPVEGVESKDSEDAMEYLEEVASNVRAGETASAVIPHGANLDIKGVYGTSANILGTLGYHNAEISNSLLQYFANLANASHGSHAQSKNVTKAYNASLNATATRIANLITAHVVEDLVERNYGPTAAAPAVVHGEIGVDIRELVEVMAGLKREGLIFADRPTEDWVRRETGLPPKTDPKEARR